MSDSGSRPEPADIRAPDVAAPASPQQPERPARPAQPAQLEQPAPAGDHAAPATGTRGTVPGKDPLRGSRASGVWVAVVALVVLLILLSVFILQNTQPVQVSYFGAEGEAPLAAALLIAVAAGLLVAVIAGSLRILQLRRRVRSEQKR